MTKRMILVALLVVPVLLAGCGTESRDAGEEYVMAVLKGDEAKALELACEDFQDGTTDLIAAYAEQNIYADSIDLKFDIGKANNQKEIIVTGSYKWGLVDEEGLTAQEVEKLRRERELTEGSDTRIVLGMREVDGNWCVSAESKFGNTVLTRVLTGDETGDAYSGTE